MKAELTQLLEKFWSGQCSPQELAALRQLLSDLSPELRSLMQREFDSRSLDSNLSLTEKEAADLLSEIQSKIQHKDPQVSQEKPSPRIFMPWYRWAAAAAAIILCSTILFKYVKKDDISIVQNTDTLLSEHERLKIYNHKDVMDTILLSDRSQVVLYPNSQISFLEGFEKNKRDIELSGKATFSVARDTTRPFTVFADDVRTTALGTVFTVQSRSEASDVQVALIEGKVVVGFKDSSAGSDVYLYPGQECVLDPGNKKLLVKEVRQKPVRKDFQPAVARAGQLKAQLKFYREPLANILNQLDQRFSASIRYDPEVVRHLSFTGEFAPSDSLSMILDIICRTNDLEPVFQDSIVIIKRKE